MDKYLRAALPYVAAISTGGLCIWAVSHYFKALPTKSNRNLQTHFKYPLKTLEELEDADWECVGEIDKLWIYPIKSCGGISLEEATAENHGFRHKHLRDRSLMIVDKNDITVTGRKETRTVLITPSATSNSNCITLQYPDVEPLQLDLSNCHANGRVISCSLMKESVSGVDCGDEVAAWLEGIFNKKYRLVYHLPCSSSRSVAEEEFPMTRNSDSGLYSDGFGYLLMANSSVKDLEMRSPCHLETENFRPNILITGSEAYDEDNWTYIKIGQAILRNIKPCDRCVFTTIEAKTGKRNPKMEPLKTLKKYRCDQGNKDPYFGILLGLDKSGTLARKDKVYILRN